jgi:hypothetical protein
MILAIGTTDLVTLIGAVSAAIVAVITAWRIGGVKKELTTMNESSPGQLLAATETRRIRKIPIGRRTAKEIRHVADDKTTETE